MFFRKNSNSGSDSWIVVFLGNPGMEYRDTRHNVGFMTADICENKFGVRINRIKYRSLMGSGTVSGSKTVFMKPQTYMNLSGDAVAQAVQFYKIPPEHVLVISDDVSLPVGKLRIRRSGSAGGHNGLKSIIQNLGTDQFPRIKIGVGIPPEHYDMKDWVLGKFHGEDAKLISDAVRRAADAVECYIEEGPDKAMNKYN